ATQQPICVPGAESERCASQRRSRYPQRRRGGVGSATVMVPPGQTRVIFSSQAVVFQAYCKFTFDGDPELVRGTYSHEDAAGSDTRLLLQARVLEDAGPAVDTLLVTPPFNKVDPGNFGCQAQNLSNAAVEVEGEIRNRLGVVVDTGTVTLQPD